MKKLSKMIGIILFAVLSVNIQAENIDECKSDLYFANGIMMKYSEEDALRMWQKEAKKLLTSNPDIYSTIENIKISYNVSQGFLDDLIESFEQVMSDEWGWEIFTAFFKAYLTDKGIQEDWIPHIKDLTKQVNSYKESIKLGHEVVVIAHSQGNYYTNEAYGLLDDWMKPYFKMMGVATPANHVAGFEVGDTTAPYVKFHNDFIKLVVTGLSSNRDDPNPNHNGTFSVAAHDFYESYLTAENTKGEILGFIETKVEEHTIAPSQWETNKEFERNTCDYRITVKHRHDPDNITMDNVDTMVYPFAAAKKLYQAKNEHGVYEYVKASCGGENVLSDWNGKKDNECLMIDNPQEEKIGGGCRIESLFDYNDEGWMIIGDAQQGGSKPNYMDGYIQAVDDVIGGTWYYSAPSKFSGDLSSCYGGSFTFDLMQSRTDRPFVSQDIIIHSNYGTVSYTFGYAPSTSWTSFKKEMVETDWDRSLTEEEFKEILSSVISINIRGEYRVGYDVGSLDNVIMSQKE